MSVTRIAKRSVVLTLILLLAGCPLKPASKTCTLYRDAAGVLYDVCR